MAFFLPFRLPAFSTLCVERLPAELYGCYCCILAESAVEIVNVKIIYVNIQYILQKNKIPVFTERQRFNLVELYISQQCDVQINVSFSKKQNIFTEMGRGCEKEVSLNAAKNFALTGSR